MKKLMIIGVSLIALTGLTGCATIISGTTQDVTINTNPAGAHCVVKQDGTQVADISRTPDTRKFDRTKHDLEIYCQKPTCTNNVTTVDSGVAPWTFGNILLGGLIGWGIDSAVGADNEYEKNVSIPMNCTGSRR